MPYPHAPSDIGDASAGLHDYTCWQHPFRDTRIYIHPVALRTLSTEALHCLKAKQASEIGGILWGKMPAHPDDPVVIENAAFVPSEGHLYNATSADARDIARAITSRQGNGSAIVGYFRSHIREGLCLSAQDKTVIEAEFHDPNAVFLIIKPFDIGICMAGFFFWDGGRLQIDASDLEVPFVALNEPLDAEPASHQIIRNPQPETPKSPSTSPSIASAIAETRKSPISLLSVATAVATGILVLIGSLAAFLTWPLIRSGLQIVSTYTPPAEIGLQVARGPGGRLNLSWNSNALQIRQAQTARLTISDGPLSREWNLDKLQLRSGKITYFPTGGDVQFRLEMYLDSRRSSAESVRVLSPGVKTSREEPSPGAVARAEPQPGSNRLPVPHRHDRNASKQARAFTSAALQKAEPASVTRGLEKPPDIPLDISLQSENAVSIPPFLALTTPIPPPARPSPPAKESVSSPPSSLNGNQTSAYVPPKPIQEVMPDMRSTASVMVYDVAEIFVQVNVDQSGRVTAAHVVENGKENNSLLASASLAAAKRWLFAPAVLNGKTVPAEHVIVFKFRP